MTITIREAVRSDCPLLLRLTRELALFERKTSDQILVTEEALLEFGFGPNRVFNSLIAELDDEAVGMAVYFFTYSGGLGAPILYIEDLFVLPDARGNGIGTRLLRSLAGKAENRSCTRMEWHVFSWNAPAIDFYTRLGGAIKDDLLQVRLERSHFRSLLPPQSKTGEISIYTK